MKAQLIMRSYSEHTVIATSVLSNYFDGGMNSYHKSFGVRPEIRIKIALDKNYRKRIQNTYVFNIHC